MTEICTNKAYATHQWHLWQIIILREQFAFFFSNLYTGQWRKRGLLGWAVFKCLATCRKSVCQKQKDKKPLTPLYHARSSLVLLTRKLFFISKTEQRYSFASLLHQNIKLVLIQPMTKSMCVFKRMHSSNKDLEYLLKTCMVSCIWI